MTIRPMMAVAASTLPVGPRWTYEVKWDGYRTIAIKDGSRVTLLSRNGKSVGAQYPGIAAAVGKLAPESTTLDGEVVALDERGQPSFQALQHRATTSLTLVYYVFDLLALNGKALTGEPLDERRRLLAAIPLTRPLFSSEPLPGTADDIVRAVKKLRLEGVVAKRRDSIYVPGRRSDAWVKVRFSQRQEFVVGGYKPAGDGFDSILVGYYEGRKLLFASKVRAGFTPQLRRDVLATLSRLHTARCPFVNLPSSRTSHWGEGVTADEMVTLRWIKPRVVAEVAFTEWTRDGALRHAAFVAMREDKAAADVVRET